MKGKILTFIKHHKLAVMATTHPDGRPQAAAIEIGETPSLSLILDTLNTPRKYRNLKKNPNVALVVGWDESITVQYEGVAKELSGAELTRCKKLYFKKNPRAKKWEDRPGVVYFKVTPKWIRYSDLRTSPWKIQEITF